MEIEVLPCTLSVDFSSSNTRGGGGVRSEGDESGAAVEALARRLEAELRAAKSEELSCGEVLLPAELLREVAAEALAQAEVEPCGLRGCTLFIEFGGRRVRTLKLDPLTVSTFELWLRLRPDPRPTWTSLLPQFIKNLTKGGTVMISPEFGLEKKKLYRSYLD